MAKKRALSASVPVLRDFKFPRWQNMYYNYSTVQKLQAPLKKSVLMLLRFSSIDDIGSHFSIHSYHAYAPSQPLSKP